MLLTVPWAASLWVARCDINEFGEAKDGVCTRKSLTQSVVSVDTDTKINARIMVVSSLTYFIVQGVAFHYVAHPESGEKVERPYSLAGFIICFLGLIAYCIYQVLVPKLAEKRQFKAEKVREERNIYLRALNIAKRMGWHRDTVQDSTIPINTRHHVESSALHAGRLWKKNVKSPDTGDKIVIPKEEVEEAAEEEDHSPFYVRFLKAFALLIIGTASCAFFSDPMVDTINNFGKTINVPAFYISFIITPYCSNASELISSLVFAAKKKKANTSMTYSQLYGAATMNNTLCLGIFFALVYFKELAWTFSAETLTIFLVTLIVGLTGSFLSNIKVIWGVFIIMLYPLSLVMVYLLEHLAHWT
eukprot:TRINITY_DN3925_c0_g1_i5.p1 TRINITY_DN3925_c0_g1~~TRINITY_DN3925_c0_g1_i5.p1  ORF type:complete len:360 (-),score=33.88 TRINITY_DN3925_c0_g1_i5:64-1143(-)